MVDEESRPLMGSAPSSSSRQQPPQPEPVQPFQSMWLAKLLLIAGASALGAFAYLTRYDPAWRPSGVTGSRLELVAKRIQMAKEGRMGYAMLSDNEKESLFEEFKQSYERQYETDEEEELRFQHFRKFLEKVDLRNEREQTEGGTAVHGLTIFSDYSEEEFSRKFLGYRPSSSSSKTAKKNSKKDKKTSATTSRYEGSNKNVDWSGVLTTEVKDQGECGSCWAFSVAEQMESDAIRKGYLTTDDSLSVQQIVSCDTVDEGVDDDEVVNYGCEGGNTESAYDWIGAVGGLSLETKYKYTSGETEETGTCDMNAEKFVLTVDKYHTVDSEDDMIDFVLSTGPLSVCLDASDWASYQSGVVSSCTTEPNHCVQVVGVHTSKGYWKVRNSWGTDWGEKGYIYLKTGKDMCAISNDPTYTKVSPVSSKSSSVRGKAPSKAAKKQQQKQQQR